MDKSGLGVGPERRKLPSFWAFLPILTAVAIGVTLWLVCYYGFGLKSFWDFAAIPYGTVLAGSLALSAAIIAYEGIRGQISKLDEQLAFEKAKYGDERESDTVRRFSARFDSGVSMIASAEFVEVSGGVNALFSLMNDWCRFGTEAARTEIQSCIDVLLALARSKCAIIERKINPSSSLITSTKDAWEASFIVKIILEGFNRGIVVESAGAAETLRSRISWSWESFSSGRFWEGNKPKDKVEVRVSVDDVGIEALRALPGFSYSHLYLGDLNLAKLEGVKDFSYSTLVNSMVISDEYREKWNDDPMGPIRGMDFRDVNFCFARFLSSIVIGADVSGADFHGADLTGSGFVHGCKAEGVKVNGQTIFFDGEPVTEEKLESNSVMPWVKFSWSSSRVIPRI